jgi:hypothetical protein
MLVTAGFLLFILGLIHSVLGEILIFKRMRDRSIIPTHGGDLLKERHVRILWATWHLVTILAWGIGVVLYWISTSAPAETVPSVLVINTIVVTVFIGAALVLTGTKGKHPGWIVLLLIATLAWLA